MMKRLLAVLILGIGSFLASLAFAADTKIKCSESPLSGLPFTDCAVGEPWKSFKGGENRRWWAYFKDKQSEILVFYRAGINGGGGLGRVMPSDILDELRRETPRMTRDGTNWGKLVEKNEDDYYVNFDGTNGQKCMGFYRRGPRLYTDAWKWMMYAVFCRVSDVPIPVSEGQFVVDMIKLKQ
jgi:hypothetical protein